MADVPDLVERPALRCFGPPIDRRHVSCGAPAVWQRPGRDTLEAAFFCDVHRQPGDEPIAEDAVFRRITLDVEVRFAATSLLEAHARIEALARLEQAVHAAGGVLSVGRVTSIVGRLRPRAGAGEKNAGGGSRR